MELFYIIQQMCVKYSYEKSNAACSNSFLTSPSGSKEVVTLLPKLGLMNVSLSCLAQLLLYTKRTWEFARMNQSHERFISLCLLLRCSQQKYGFCSEKKRYTMQKINFLDGIKPFTSDFCVWKRK